MPRGARSTSETARNVNPRSCLSKLSPERSLLARRSIVAHPDGRALSRKLLAGVLGVLLSLQECVVAELILLVIVLSFGFACGYSVRETISRRRRARWWGVN